jgi:tRNA modification GTPase
LSIGFFVGLKKLGWMLSKLSGWEDTIVALATAPGIGAIGVIRLSGKKSLEIVNGLFPSKNLLIEPSHSLHIGWLKDEEKELDEVVIALYRGPKSYTGEDVVEVSCHGSPYLQERVIQLFISKGARLAGPGEFTQRAFLNGKMDLAQAEAVADLIASHSEAASRSAINMMRGGFSNDLQHLRERLLRFSSLIELELDFSQEDVEFANRDQLNDLIEESLQKTQSLLRSFSLGNVIKNGVEVVIIGKPNAGKSTLLNSLLNEDRAIVSEIAGTTRDSIEETLNIDGILFRLVDTAGIRAHADSSIEQLGVERSFQKMKRADLLIYLFDVATTQITELEEQQQLFAKDNFTFILVGNKIDGTGEEVARKNFDSVEPIIFISAKYGQYIDILKKRLVELVLEGKVNTEDTIVTNTRHYEALLEVESSLKEIQTGLKNQLPGDLLSTDIRHALHSIGVITGEITTEDQLGYIFSKFCIGK